MSIIDFSGKSMSVADQLPNTCAKILDIACKKMNLRRNRTRLIAHNNFSVVDQQTVLCDVSAIYYINEIKQERFDVLRLIRSLLSTTDSTYIETLIDVIRDEIDLSWLCANWLPYDINKQLIKDLDTYDHTNIAMIARIDYYAQCLGHTLEGCASD